MLADDLIASPQVEVALGEDRAEFVALLRKAHRFSLDRLFASAADQIAFDRPTAFERCVPVCRPPFDVCWFETVFYDRPQFAGSTLVPGTTGGVHRVGVLVEAHPERPAVFLAHLAWSFRDFDGVSVCPMSMSIDMADGSYATQERQRWGWQPARASDMTRLRGDEAAAGARIENRTCMLVSRFYRRRIETLGADVVPFDSAYQDWAGEVLFWCAAIALMNSRNVAEVEPVDVQKLNRNRRASGKHELLDYSVCKISQRVRQRMAAERRATSEAAALRAHFVRGHFKARKTGVFWWSPYIRGDASAGFVQKDYELRGAVAA